MKTVNSIFNPTNTPLNMEDKIESSEIWLTQYFLSIIPEYPVQEIVLVRRQASKKRRDFICLSCLKP